LSEPSGGFYHGVGRRDGPKQVKHTSHALACLIKYGSAEAWNMLGAQHGPAMGKMADLT
jgi:hypothetical protein